MVVVRSVLYHELLRLSINPTQGKGSRSTSLDGGGCVVGEVGVRTGPFGEGLSGTLTA